MTTQRSGLLLSFSLLQRTSVLRSIGNRPNRVLHTCRLYSSQSHTTEPGPQRPNVTPDPGLSHLNPAADDYSRFIFQDKCRSVIHAGSGGNGCVSFLREKYIEEGPPNGGDGGSGGNVYIQAVEGMTSLHKLARRGIIKASRGRNGQGKRVASGARIS